MEKYRVLIIILVVIAIVFSAIVIAFSVFTSSQEYEKINNPFESMGVDNGYRIVEADYKINVGDDRVALVTESITVAFIRRVTASLGIWLRAKASNTATSRLRVTITSLLPKAALFA